MNDCGSDLAGKMYVNGLNIYWILFNVRCTNSTKYDAKRSFFASASMYIHKCIKILSSDMFLLVMKQGINILVSVTLNFVVFTKKTMSSYFMQTRICNYILYILIHLTHHIYIFSPINTFSLFFDIYQFSRALNY